MGERLTELAEQSRRCLALVASPGVSLMRPAHTAHRVTSLQHEWVSDCLTIFLGVAWERGDMISPHSDLRLIPTRGGPQRVVADAQWNLEFNSVHALSSASLTDEILVTRVTVCSAHKSSHWFLFVVGMGHSMTLVTSLSCWTNQDKDHSPNWRCAGTCSSAPPGIGRALAGAGRVSRERPAPGAPQAAGARQRRIRHGKSGKRGTVGTGTSLIMWTDNTNNLYPSTIQIISSCEGK